MEERLKALRAYYDVAPTKLIYSENKWTILSFTLRNKLEEFKREFGLCRNNKLTDLLNEKIDELGELKPAVTRGLSTEEVKDRILKIFDDLIEAAASTQETWESLKSSEHGSEGYLRELQMLRDTQIEHLEHQLAQCRISLRDIKLLTESIDQYKN